MTCKDCKKWKTCKYPNKSDKPDLDGDTWANWCGFFETIHVNKEVEYEHWLIVQGGYTWHISIWDLNTNQLLHHMSCTVEKTEEELKQMLLDFIKERYKGTEYFNPVWYLYACPRWSRKRPTFGRMRITSCLQERLPRLLERFANDPEHEIYFLSLEHDVHHAQKWMRVIWERDKEKR